jgi:hypothetical protein
MNRHIVSPQREIDVSGLRWNHAVIAAINVFGMIVSVDYCYYFHVSIIHVYCYYCYYFHALDHV